MAKAVIFDFDGVIVRSEPLHYKTFSEVLAPLGVRISRGRWYRDFAGTGSHNIISVLLRESGIGADAEALVEERKRLFARYAGQGRLRPMPGLRRFLLAIRKRGMKTAIASGGHTQSIKQILEKLGLRGRFDAVVGCEEARNRKPHPEIFLIAARKLGVAPEDCIAIEDSIPGAEAARKAGMRLVVVRSPATVAITGYELLIDDFTSLDEDRIGAMLG